MPVDRQTDIGKPAPSASTRRLLDPALALLRSLGEVVDENDRGSGVLGQPKQMNTYIGHILVGVLLPVTEQAVDGIDDDNVDVLAC